MAPKQKQARDGSNEDVEAAMRHIITVGPARAGLLFVILLTAAANAASAAGAPASEADLRNLCYDQADLDACEALDELRHRLEQAIRMRGQAVRYEQAAARAEDKGDLETTTVYRQRADALRRRATLILPR
jgi:hypothetical protein